MIRSVYAVGASPREVRTNSESIIGVRVPRKDVDFSRGIAIGRAHLVSHAILEVAHYSIAEEKVAGEIRTKRPPGRLKRLRATPRRRSR